MVASWPSSRVRPPFPSAPFVGGASFVGPHRRRWPSASRYCRSTLTLAIIQVSALAKNRARRSAPKVVRPSSFSVGTEHSYFWSRLHEPGRLSLSAGGGMFRLRAVCRRRPVRPSAARVQHLAESVGEVVRRNLDALVFSVKKTAAFVAEEVRWASNLTTGPSLSTGRIRIHGGGELVS